MLDGWNIETRDLPGYTPPPDWWRGPVMELFVIPDTPLAYVVYNHDEIGLSAIAGNFALFHDRDHPVRLFAPRSWLIGATPFSIQSAGEASMVLIYLANARETIEKYVLLDLHTRRFVPLFIPNPLFHYTFTRLDTGVFALMPPGERDAPPYRRSYMFDTSTLRWQPYHRADDGFDDTAVAAPIRDRLWHYRSGSWQRVWDRAYRLALVEETPNDARIVSNRVLDRINANDMLITMPGGYAVQVDERRLWPFVEEERAKLHLPGRSCREGFK